MRVSKKNVHSRRPQGDQPQTPEGTQAAIRVALRFLKSHRILTRTDFRQIAGLRQRFQTKVLVIDYRASTHPRLGITASRKFGNAVLRNRFKRLIREGFRHIYDQLPPFDIVIMPRSIGHDISFDQVIEGLLEFSHAQSTTAKSS